MWAWHMTKFEGKTIILCLQFSGAQMGWTNHETIGDMFLLYRLLYLSQIGGAQSNHGLFSQSWDLDETIKI